MSHEEKVRLWQRFPEVWELFEKYNDIAQEDEAAWRNLVRDVQRVSDRYKLPAVDEILRETASELDKISRRRRGEIF